ncbi:MAG: AmmeMemoRadiSam system protein B [Candidatus Omnitrophica bacterium]|nr:AmmeMemoRadiSam system protein B [Candidatus Omnitrophota bacterium]
MKRNPAVAGQFYPLTAEAVEKQVYGFIEKPKNKINAIGVVSPHAGYIYSGPVAGSVYSRIELKPTYIIIGPNHTGKGKPYSLMSEGSWVMPQGEIDIDVKLAKALLSGSEFLEEDFLAHAYEHSIEVQLPFLQYFKSPFKIVPIIISYSKGHIYQAIGREIAKAVKESKKDVMIIASSDMTHYESQEDAHSKDMKAIEAILKLDEEELVKRVEKFDISMCGYAPVSVMLAAAKELGAKSAELVKYQTSGDASGDYSSVVGYAGIIIK